MPKDMHGPGRGQGVGQDDGLGQGHSRSDVDLMQERKALFHATGDDAFLDADHFYFAQFTTLNGSGVTGGAILAVDDQTSTLTVAIAASGLEPNQTHIQHIHGFPDGTEAQTPSEARDADGDGFVELGEGLLDYGPILLNLSVNHANGTGDDNGHSHDGAVTGFPTAPNGDVYYVETFQLPAGDLSVDPMLDLREVVLHGMTVPDGAGLGTSGEVNGSGGYQLVLPVASGEIAEVGSAHDLRTFVQDIGLTAHSDWMV